MPIHIDEYEHNSFEYDKWIISDDYRELKFGYEYRIIVSTKETIKDYNDLTYDVNFDIRFCGKANDVA